MKTSGGRFQTPVYVEMRILLQHLGPVVNVTFSASQAPSLIQWAYNAYREISDGF